MKQFSVRMAMSATAVVTVLATSTVASATESARNVPRRTAPPRSRHKTSCQKTIDLFQYMAPQLGVAMTGGNATLGQGGALGGLCGSIVVEWTCQLALSFHSAKWIRSLGTIVTGAHSSDYPTKSQLLGLPQLDASIGLFKGIPLPVTNVGGVDLLVTATYLPSFNSGTVKVTEPSGSLKLGVGARLGIIQESILFPGIAVTYLHRDLPTVNMACDVPRMTDTLRVSGLDVHTGRMASRRQQESPIIPVWPPWHRGRSLYVHMGRSPLWWHRRPRRRVPSPCDRA